MTQLVLASRWTHANARRGQALQALQKQDVAAVCELVTYHVRLKGVAGSDTSPRTLRSYHLAVRDFLGWCWSETQTVALNQLTSEQIEQYLLDLRTRPRHPRTRHARPTDEHLSADSARTYLYGVRAMTRALVWADVLDDDPTREVRAPRARTAAHERKGALPTSLLDELLALPHTHRRTPGHGARDVAILMLGARLGLRLDEMVHLDVADLDLRAARLRVRQGKGRKARTVDVPPGTLAALQTWLTARRAVISGQEDHGALLISFQPAARGRRLSSRGLYAVVSMYGQMLGLDETLRGVHALRRTAGTRLYRATRDLHVVADVLGHASIATSAVYAKLDTSTRKAALIAAEEVE
ncbi:tyrosine-type recombinase/integrase [Deinococcus saxicola]|uniref:tyrosine-type recombinase/integrase n=1 Tax=Deinococcus TaxID=1298 RepID=UPI0004951DB6|nr:tyrosine-type recombinase/integrase [Deinococcus marmoris]